MLKSIRAIFHVSVRVMSACETAPILGNTSSVENEVNCALSINCSDSSTEDIRSVPEVIFEPALDSPAVNRESQPLLGGLDVSYNHFPGKLPSNNITHLIRQLSQMIQPSVTSSGKPRSPSTMAFFRKGSHKDPADHILSKIPLG